MSAFLNNRRAFPEASIIGTVAAQDGWILRTFNWPSLPGVSRGSILFQTGRGDMFEKYLETFAHWHDLGWDVTAFDWRGQGGSGRLTTNPNVGHIDDFETWIDDLAYFTTQWSAASPGPHVVMGHSMGGHLVLRALVENRVKVDAAVLIAPMLGFETPPMTPRFSARLAKRMAKWLPNSVPAWPGNEKPSLPGASRQKFLTFDDERYSDELWWRAQKPELQLGPPSWQWLSAAYKSFEISEAEGRLEQVDSSILILGTAGDKLVSPAAIRRCAKRLPQAKLVMFDKGVAHEILRECDGPRNHALAEIDELLAQTSPSQ
jgi:lysophospholipase